MPILKESSDNLNPPVVTQGVSITPSSGRRTAGDYLALAVATCGVGLLPLAPGTWGSAVGVGIFLLFDRICRILIPYPLPSEKNLAYLDMGFEMMRVVLWRTSGLLIVVIVVTVIGTWAATRAEKVLGKKDPGAVVVDEVAGQLIAFLFVPLHAGWWAIGAAFILFRLFDIWKPYPIRRLESLGGGLGIMADDVLAGIYAAVLMALLISIYLLIKI